MSTPGSLVRCQDISLAVEQGWCNLIHPTGTFTPPSVIVLSCDELATGLFPLLPECVADRDHNSIPNFTCAGGEILGDVTVHCQLLEDNQTVRVTAGVHVLEGTDCAGGHNIFDDDEQRSAGDGPIEMGPGACTNCCVRPPATEPNASCHLHAIASLEGGDFGELTLDLGSNVEGEHTIVNPILAENRRKVHLVGDLLIRDDEFDQEGDPPTEKTLDVDRTCLVDPLAPTDEIIYTSECVGGETRVEIKIVCSLGPDKVSVKVTTEAKLFEETSCGSNDLDGSESRDVLLAPGQVSSLNAPEFGDTLRIDNEDEGGDFAEFRGTIQNDVQ